VLSAAGHVLLAAALAVAAPWSAAQAPARGFFLVAKPSIVDPNFERTVVLATHAPDGATLGVILNRPTKQSLANILPGNDKLARFTAPLHFGGPVERVGLFAVFRAKEGPAQSFPVIEDVHLALHPATVEQLLIKPPAELRLFVGYSGWAPGQLQGELARGDWWTLDADVEIIFRKNNETLWDELARRARAITADRKPQQNAEDPDERGRTRIFPDLSASIRVHPRSSAAAVFSASAPRRPTSRTSSRRAGSRRGPRPSPRTAPRGSPWRAGSRPSAGSRA